MPSNTKEYMNEYMKKYIKNSKDVICDVCESTYKSYKKSVHVKGKRHLSKMSMQFLRVEVDEVTTMKQKLNELIERLEKYNK